jgi:hypothetical protein
VAITRNETNALWKEAFSRLVDVFLDITVFVSAVIECLSVFVLQSNGPTDSYSAISQQDKVRVEPEKIRLWREEQQKRLLEKGLCLTSYLSFD